MHYITFSQCRGKGLPIESRIYNDLLLLLCFLGEGEREGEVLNTELNFLKEQHLKSVPRSAHVNIHSSIRMSKTLNFPGLIIEREADAHAAKFKFAK